MRARRKQGRIFWLLVLAAVGLAIWYQELEPGRKHFVQNLVRQLPDLPARYAV